MTNLTWTRRAERRWCGMSDIYDRSVWLEILDERDRKITSLEDRVRELEGPLYMQLCSRLIGHITSTDAKCDPPTDIELRLVAIIRERDQAREALRNHEELYLAARRYVAIAQSNKSPYIRENGRHGGSPWSELVDAVNNDRWTGHARSRIDVGGET